MANTVNGLDQALTAIQNANLRYPDAELLQCFLQESINPAAAACYMLQRCSLGGYSDGFDFLPLLSDWKELIASFTYETHPKQKPNRHVVADIWNRDRGKCCITGFSGSLFDPLVVVPILPMVKPIQKSLHEMLRVFIGPEIQQRILFQDASSLQDARNHWLVRKSAAAVLSQGWFQFTYSSGTKYCVNVVRIGGPIFPSIVDKTPTVRFRSFPDPSLSTSTLEIPEDFIFQVVSRFAKAIRWTLVAREIATKQLQRQQRQQRQQARAIRILYNSSILRPLLEHVAVSINTLWRRLVPITFRIQVYCCLGFLGMHMYGSSGSLKVQQIPFGMYLKTARAEDHGSLANEHGALELMRRHTTVPVPRPLDLVSNAEISYLITSRVPGQRLGACIDTLSDDEVNTLIHDLQNYIGQLREIPKTTEAAAAPKNAYAYAISNAIGQACYDFRIMMAVPYDEERRGCIGPFVDEDEFNKTLQTPALPGHSHRSGHKIVFTHSDLNMRNILIHPEDGRLSGIVDWENSGWYPEYWDYTKARFITKLNQRWLSMVDEIFKPFGPYQTELATERRFWDYCY